MGGVLKARTGTSQAGTHPVDASENTDVGMKSSSLSVLTTGHLIGFFLKI